MTPQMRQRGRPRKVRQEQEIAEVNQPNLETKAETALPIPTHPPLLGFALRIETQEDEKAIAQKTILDIYAEAKEQGIATPILREAIRLRKLSQNERNAYEALRDQYMQTLGLKT